MNFFPACPQAKRAFLCVTMLRLFALLFLLASLSRRSVRAATFSTFQDAGLVVGQANLTATNSAFTQSSTPGAVATAISSKGVLAVANGPRVLLFASIPTTNGANASIVVGQPDFTSNTPATSASASLMAACSGVAFSPDGTKLLVADSGNNRVLIWNTIPTQNGQAADVVIGQSDFTSKVSATTVSGLNSPTGVLVTPSGKLLIADQVNARVLVYNAIPTQNFASASVVIGQSDFTSAVPGMTANRLTSPAQMALTSDGRLLVSDGGTQSVRIWNAIPTSNNAAASVVIGQSNFSTSDSGTSASQLFSPVGVSVSPTGQLAIGEYNNSRALIFNSVPTTNGASADVVLGQPDFTSRQANNGGLSAKSMFQVSGVTFAPDGRLLVAAPGNNRVLVFGIANAFPTISTNALPKAYFGQSYSAQLAGADADGDPLTWSVVGGTLPPGITLSSNGLLSGTPTQNGLYSVQFQVSDGQGGTAKRSLFLTVAEVPSLVVTTASDIASDMDNLTSLRDAIAYANTLSGSQSVSFNASLGGQTITLGGTQLPAVTGNLIILTPAGGLTLDGAAKSRILQVNAGASLTLADLALNNGKGSLGAGLHNEGTVSLTRCTFTGNVGNTSPVSGGGLYSNNMATVTDCTFTNNSCILGGGLYNQNGGTMVCTRITATGNNGNNGAGLANYGTLTVTDSTFTGNTSNSGSGIFNANALTLSNSVLSNNVGVALDNGGTINVNNCTIDSNRGGGVSNSYSLNMSNCTVSNSVGSGISTGNLATISNCTLSGNVASVKGGGIFNNSSSALVTVSNCTLVGNSAPAGKGGSIFNGGPLSIGGTILSAASGSENLVNDPGGFGNLSFGSVTSRGYNLSSDNASTYLNKSGDQNNVNPKVGVLAANGGPTLTVALLPGSPAINAGDPAFNATGTPFDQRGSGFPRVKHGRIDIGAFEIQNVPPVLASVTLSPANPTTNDTLTATPSASDADGDAITYSYLWKKNGEVIGGEIAASLDLSKAGNGDKGDLITVSVTASDSRATSPSVTSDAVTIQNSAPVVSGVSIDQTAPKTSDTLSIAVGTLTDADSDTLTPTYQWKKNGSDITGATDATLDLSVAGNGDKGDSISVVVTVSDGTATSSSTSGSVTIGNSAPSVRDVTITPTNPTTGSTLIASVTASDADNDTLTYSYAWKKNGSILTGETGSTLDLSVAGNGNQGDSITVTVTANDGTGSPAIGSDSVTIGNTAPSIGSVAITPANPTTSSTLTANVTASDADNDTLTYTYVWKKNGTAIAGETGATLDLSQAGNGDRGDQITVVVSATDGTSIDSQESTSRTVDNSAPNFTGATIDTPNPTTTSLLTAIGSATDADGDDLVYSYTWKKNGVVIAGEAGSSLDLSKAGNGDKGDAISVVVTVDDGQGGTASKESQGVAIVGSAPTGLSLSPSSIAENQLPGTTVGAFTTSGMDAGNSYSYSLVAGAGDTDNAAFKIAGATLLSNHPFDFESKASYSIRVRSVDGDGKAVETIFTITITDVNEAPSVRVTLSPAAPTTNTLLQATTTGSDPDGDAITFTYQWKKGGAVLVGETGSTLDLSKAGNGDKGDTLSVVVVPVDGTLSGTGATASTTVLNSAPTLSPATFQGRENQVLPGQLAGQDADREALSYSLVSPPRSGTLALQSSGAFAYTPRSNWNGTDTFQARVRDGSGATATALFTLRIAPANGTPVALNDVVKGFEDTPLSIPASLLLRNDSNGENVGEVDALQIVRVAVPTGFPGTLKLDVARQTITFTPKLNWNGTTTFTYTVQDSGKATVTAQVTLQIAPVNDAPVAFPGRMIVLSGVLGEVPLSGTDVEGDALAFALGTKPTSGAAVVVKVGTQWKLRYQSKVGFSGTDTLSVIARDGKLNSAPATITITVKPNHAPQLVSLAPNKGSFVAGSTVVFEQKVRDADGTANLDATALLIGNSPTVANARGGATLWFDAVGNRFTLTKDDGATSLAPVALGGTLENSQVKVTLGAGDVVRDSYGNLTLKWHVTFRPSFVGTKSLWARAEDLGGLSAGFTSVGTLTLSTPAKDTTTSLSAPTS